MYSLHSVDDDRNLGTATGLEEFFVDSDESWRTFGVAGFSAAGGDLPSTVDHLEIRVHGTDDEVLGAYSVSNAEIEPSPTLRVTGYLLDVPGPDAEIAWRRLRGGGLRQPGAWTTLSAAEKHGWLDAVRMHADLLPQSADVAGGVYDLDGRAIVDETSFYCAAGEALRGPGGYFGSVLDAFRDCLHGGFGVKPPFELRWRAMAASRTALGETTFDDIIKTLRSAGVTVTPLP